MTKGNLKFEVMIFQDSKSSLVRLTDSIKDIMYDCYDTTEEIIKLYKKNSIAFEELQVLAKNSDIMKMDSDDFEEKAIKITSKISENDILLGTRLQRVLHSKSLFVVLTSCFVLESYINSLAFHLFKKEDYLGLLREGHDITAEILLKSIDQMKALEKWEALGQFKTGHSFDKSKAPYQHCKIIFSFRNDIVHDKVVAISNDRSKRYNNLLPDPIFGMLDLSHAKFAAQTYWDMIIEIHNLLDYDIEKFHKHYNLMPWENENQRKEIEQLSSIYKKIFP